MTTTSSTSQTDPTRRDGTGVVPGLAYAPVEWMRPARELVPRADVLPQEEREPEAARLQAAAEAVAARLQARAEAASGAASEVLAATAGMARDRGWVRAARRQVLDGVDASTAVSAAIGDLITRFEQAGGLMAERTTDLRDVRDRVVAELEGWPEPGLPRPGHPFVLLAEDLAPADTADLDPSVVRAVVTSLGGPTSHTSIIARQLGIPCVVGVAGLDTVPPQAQVLVDAGRGRLELDPDPARAEEAVASDQAARARIAAWTGPARTLDGHRVDLLANVQHGDAARAAADGPAEGVGLFRTELGFLAREDEPSVEEQADIYGGVLAPFAPEAKVLTRTLDAGSDKPLSFITLPEEPNPALGVRGARIAALDPGVLTRQLDALAAAAERVGRPLADTWVMAPMIATAQEAQDFAALVRERGMRPGVMVEVPSAALTAAQLLEHVDFLSIGTNDLTQYVMAADRMSPTLAGLADAWQPAVLQLVAMTARAGEAKGAPVGVCGEAAADPDLACVLVGLGVTSLSMAVGAIPAVGARLGQVSRAQCRAAADAALAAGSALQARADVASVLG